MCLCIAARSESEPSNNDGEMTLNSTCLSESLSSAACRTQSNLNMSRCSGYVLSPLPHTKQERSQTHSYHVVLPYVLPISGPVNSSALPTPASVPQCLGTVCPSPPVHRAHCTCSAFRQKVINDHVMIVFGPCCRVVWPKQILLCRVHPHTDHGNVVIIWLTSSRQHIPMIQRVLQVLTCPVQLQTPQ
jgi:hypothetical protein